MLPRLHLMFGQTRLSFLVKRGRAGFAKGLRTGYGLYLVLIAHLTLVDAWYYAHHHHPWIVGDWLISYRGGFVRRGLFGEVVYHLGTWLYMDPAYLVLVAQILFIWSFLGLAYLALLRQPDWRPYLLLLTAPYPFPFHFLCLGCGYRKEILLFAVLSFLLVTALYRPRLLERATLAVLAVYPAWILTHEMLAFFLPYVLFPLAWYMPSRVLFRSRKLWFLLALNGLALGAVLWFRGTPAHVQGIVQALQPFYPWEPNGAIGALDDAPICVLCRVVKENPRLLRFHAQAWFLVLLAFLPLERRWRRYWGRPATRYLLVLGLLMPLVLFVVAEDWGRWLYIHAVCWFLLSLLDTQRLPFQMTPRGLYGIFLVFALAYGLFWRLHHMDGFMWGCPPRDNLHVLWRWMREAHEALTN